MLGDWLPLPLVIPIAWEQARPQDTAMGLNDNHMPYSAHIFRDMG